MYQAGIDIGSTTVKMVVFTEDRAKVFEKYERHFSDVFRATKQMLLEVEKTLGKNNKFALTITGSSGIGLAQKLGISFIQEVIACTKTVEELIPETDVVIELGGEDAKIIFFKDVLEQRMNGSCAGGTGAFIDQMATLLKTDASGLNEFAKNYTNLHPIASRCGVFAKTDVQPLLNEGAAKEDIAASVFQAVVNQTIAGLASGRKISGKVAFLGGPLFFLSELKKRFIETLGLSEVDVISPEDSQLFVAMGAALFAQEEEEISLEELICRFEEECEVESIGAEKLPNLFSSEEELNLFRKRHGKSQPKYRLLKDYKGAAFLGIDAGSTTSKVVLLSKDEEILFEYYGNNEGQPLENVQSILCDLYRKLPKDIFLEKACVTGYGEQLIQNALKVDFGVVETMAHYRAANHFYPGVEFVLDIGGQDMKAMSIKEGALSNIQLNEACSSGCGSFIEGFAHSLLYSVEEFASQALFAKNPVDLGSRCTVFMNSKVKQAQKEGASIGEISAGLSYSVIKNALYKVMKVRRSEKLGNKIVVQGGTFCNEAVLRAFEIFLGREVVRPRIAGLMGAFGAALIAKEKSMVEGTSIFLSQLESEKGILKKKYSTILNPLELTDFYSKKEFLTCGRCENQCLLTKHIFSDAREFVTGNRCEKGTAIVSHSVEIDSKERARNLMDEKIDRLFKYKKLSNKQAIHGTIGIPRVLNIYENYPLWATFFAELGFRVELSPRSTKTLYEKGIHTISSDTVCYPAKIVHGHVEALIDRGISRIFYPSVVFEIREDEYADNHYNCPIVQSYPEVIRNNVSEIREGKLKYHYPFLNLAKEYSVAKQLYKEFYEFGFPLRKIRKALYKGYQELDRFKADIRRKGEEILYKLKEKGERGIVLSGRPYHLDPEIHHKIAEIIVQEGFHVLTEDSISHLSDVGDLRVVNQWMYHARLYSAARVVAKSKNLEFIQLNSFGCGIDAVITDQVEEILTNAGKIYTVLKIDEGANLGAVKIRLRSLKAAIESRELQSFESLLHKEDVVEVPNFTKEMKKTHTLLMPMMSPIHQEGLIDEAFEASGYNVVVLSDKDSKAVEVGLKYVNNDVCYPAILSIGRMIEALQGGEYDISQTSVMMTQTGGGCRATNYIPLLRKSLAEAGFSQIPVVSLSVGNQGVEVSPGFKLTISLLKRLMIAVLYGDLFERIVYRTRPYELEEGSIDRMHRIWLESVRENVRNGSLKQFNQNMKEIIRNFDEIPLTNVCKPRVGVVGEILVKYAPMANNDIVQLLEAEGVEAVVPDLLGFMNYSFYNQVWRYQNLGASRKANYLAQFLLKVIENIVQPMDRELRKSKRFSGIASIDQLVKGASSILSIGNHTGEGWFLTGEMVELIKGNVDNIICMQPFGCLPNHVVGKGALKELRRQYPQINVVTIDYDPGASFVNQLNRIRLMLATAKKRMVIR